MQTLLEYWVINVSSLSYAALLIFTKCGVSIKNIGVTLLRCSISSLKFNA